MPRNTRAKRRFMADFETTTDINDCRVWAWCTADIDDVTDIQFGNDIQSFIEHIDGTANVVYFHNLAFDGAFIMDYLFRQGYTNVLQAPKDGQMTTLISALGQHYSITIKTKAGNRIEFRDSLKKLPMSVSAIAKTFNLTESKGTIDYQAFRPIGHELTDDEKEYIQNDVVIVARALHLQFQAGMKKLTVGADSLAEFKNLFNSRLFRDTFPVLNPTLDAEIRQAYRGGFTYAAPMYRGALTGFGDVYDVNSLYPSVMYTRVLPYDIPVYVPGKPYTSPEWPLYVGAATITARVKPDHIPCIQIKRSPRFVGTDYQETIDEPVTLYFTNVDWELWNDHYDIEVLEYHGMWRFKGQRGFFNSYIDKWMKVKETSKGGMRAIAKLHLNSLYGKFATNPNVTGKIPVFEDDIVKLKLGPEDERDPIYTPMGAFITAYAREQTIRAAQEHYPYFAYADTDSLHLIGCDSPNLDIHSYRMGAWAHEYSFEKGLFIRAKQYIELRSDGDYESHFAGLPRSVAEQLTFDDIRDGATFRGKLLPKRVPGGIVLTDVDFTLNLSS